MQCYVEMGQSSLALGVFKACAGALQRELGVRRCAETLRLYHQILAEPVSGTSIVTAGHQTRSRPLKAAVPVAAAPIH